MHDLYHPPSLYSPQLHSFAWRCWIVIKLSLGFEGWLGQENGLITVQNASHCPLTSFVKLHGIQALHAIGHLMQLVLTTVADDFFPHILYFGVEPKQE